MLLVQMTGLSAAGKSTIAELAARRLTESGHSVEVIDGDAYRQHLCRDLGFSAEDRKENLRRLAFVAYRFAQNGILPIIAAINPYEDIRSEIVSKYSPVYTVFVNCELPVLFERDPKGLYRRSTLPDHHPEKLHNLTGVNDPYEPPRCPDLILNTHQESIEESVDSFVTGLLDQLHDSSVRSPAPLHSSALLDATISCPGVRRALFIGRWQPFHKGHEWLIDQKLKRGIPVSIAVRNVLPDRSNPFTTEQTISMINALYSDKDVTVFTIPDIESVNYGRGVGYEIHEFIPPEDITMISATDIREAIRAHDDSWKSQINQRIHSLLIKYFRGQSCWL